MQPGPLNLITDVAGLRVGNAADAVVKTGATVLVGEAPFVAAVHVMGGAPGTRETDLLAPDKLVQEVDALVLAGGSAFGLDAAAAVAETVRAAGRGFDVGGQKVPIVPGAIVFDLLNGGNKDWAESPYRRLGRDALAAAAAEFALGTAGAGTGATTAELKGGLGSASLVLRSGHTVGALVAVNAVGSVTLDANAAQTLVTAINCGPDSYPFLTPLTADAATELAGGALYISAVGPGTFTIAHSNAASTDRRFGYVCLG